MNKAGAPKWIVAGVVLCLVLLLVWAIFTAPKNPVAIIRVTDTAGKPVAGAILTPQGLRTKPGPYQAGWYGWGTASEYPSPTPVKTDRNGYAKVGYPKYVFEKIETGVITFSVDHQAFVPSQVEREVSTKPPEGAPWRVWADYMIDRVKNHQLVARVNPVTVTNGVVLRVSAAENSGKFKDGTLYVQIPGDEVEATNFWQRPSPGVAMTRRLGAGKRMMRAIEFDDAGAPWFSDTITVDAVAGKTNEVAVTLSRGIILRGKLDETVPRPVKNGRLIAHVWPKGIAPSAWPPQWHAWTKIREDGSFEIAGLPQGNLEVVALCDGYINTNGPGKTKSFRYPQKHVPGTNDLLITVGMEPTARLEVMVTDKQGKAVKNATVNAWPNVHYGDWAAVIVGSDCYNTSDTILKHESKPFGWNVPRDFRGKSDETGLAVVPNLPDSVTAIAVESDTMVLPAVTDRVGKKQRQARVTLTAGTNKVSLQLEPRDSSPIKHY